MLCYVMLFWGSEREWTRGGSSERGEEEEGREGKSEDDA